MAFFAICCLVGSAQDIHFSQFYEPTLTLNPANTGNFLGDWRANLMYRTQWRSINNVKPFVTTQFAYDQQVEFLGQNFALGGYFVHDRSGDGKLKQNKLMVSGAYSPVIALIENWRAMPSNNFESVFTMPTYMM